MHAISVREPGGPEVLEWAQTPNPVPGNGEVLVEVAASAVNRADLLQRQGNYPPPPGASEIIGLECSGVIAELGAGVEGWQVGDPVCALLAGGGYAEKVAVPAGQLLPVPEGVDLVSAAGLPEVAYTVWSMVARAGKLRAGEVFLVHGGAGGIGTHAIQLARALGARVACTAGSDERLTRCAELGADITINYRTQSFTEVLREATKGHGADVILDNMGAKYLGDNLSALATDGRLLIIGMQGGRLGELDIAKLLGKRGTVHAAGLRGRPLADKAELTHELLEHLWPLIAQGSVRPIIEEVVPMPEAGRAHRMLEEGSAFGKLVLAT
ncbi:NAD(P)H-quinone oxidoreductase [Sciscionella marina]|uniref:NAD(P)H-quinone oxidoreductase n=1 Tax=Sciscionella marina TaxID=508770 RepID=UPI000378089C|nr:NAD(P)H-quinone oxidoreductase [Sciscionella marina]